MHRYGGNVSFLAEWTWEEAVLYVPKVLEYTNDDVLLLRWFVNYEGIYPSFAEFKRALKENAPGPTQSRRAIEADVEKLLQMDWRESDGERD